MVCAVNAPANSFKNFRHNIIYIIEKLVLFTIFVPKCESYSLVYTQFAPGKFAPAIYLLRGKFTPGKIPSRENSLPLL